MENSKSYHYSDFTRQNYRRYLQLAKKNWQFICYPDSETFRDNDCLWRHDVDCSLDCAVKTAQIEQEEGVVSTYFIHLHSAFFNPISERSLQLAKDIRNCGHEIGLHFDIFYYQQLGKLLQQSDLEKYLQLEKDLFEDWFDTRCRVMSFHNPDVSVGIDFSAFSLAGMINATSEFYRKNFDYVSDSNGYWRFNRLEDFLLAGAKKPIHILTHAEWWISEKVLNTKQRLDSAIQLGIDAAKEEHKSVLQQRGRLMP